MKATYTQWSTFNTCPHWFKRLYIDKAIDRQSSDALTKGIRIHDGIEQFLKHTSDELPDDIHESWRPFLEETRNSTPLEVEVRFENDIAYGKIDAFVGDNHIIDWKSGKQRRYDLGVREQLRFYIWLAERDVNASLAWVEHPFSKSMLTIDIPSSSTLDRIWRDRIGQMQTGPYPMTPNWKCAYCPDVECEFNKSNPKEEE